MLFGRGSLLLIGTPGASQHWSSVEEVAATPASIISSGNISILYFRFFIPL